MIRCVEHLGRILSHAANSLQVAKFNGLQDGHSGLEFGRGLLPKGDDTMIEGLIFGLAFVVTAGVAASMKQGPIVSLGGGFLLACIALAAFGPRTPGRQAVSYEDALGVVRQSSDHAVHQEAFAEAAMRLMNKRECTLSDFTAQGGWAKASKLSTQDTYFVLCGGTRVENRIYLIPATGETFRSMR